MGVPRLRKVTSQREMDTLVDDYVTQGYKILDRGERSVRVKKTDYGSIGWHVVLFFLTIGVGNVIYAVIKSSGADEVIVRLEEDN